MSDSAGVSGKLFWTKQVKNGPKMGHKQGFLNLLKDLVIIFTEYVV